MYSEQAYDLAFPEDPIKKHFEQIYKEIDDKYRPIIAEYDRLLEQFNTDGNDIVHNAEQEQSNTIFGIIYTIFAWVVEKVKSILDVGKNYGDLTETEFPDSNQIKPFEMCESIAAMQRLTKEEKLKEYCLSHLSFCIDKSLPYEISMYDQAKDPFLDKNQVDVYCYIPDYSLIESIQRKINEERNNPSSEITYTYGCNGNEWLTKLDQLHRELDKAKNSLAMVYREEIYVNPMVFVETPSMPTAIVRS